jgi:hypothetical protein
MKMRKMRKNEEKCDFSLRNCERLSSRLTQLFPPHIRFSPRSHRLMSDREVVKAANAKHASDFAATAMAVNELATAVNDASNLVENAAGIVTVVNDLAVTLRATADRAAAHERAADRVETIEVAQRRTVVPKATEDYVDAPEVAAGNTAAPEAVKDAAGEDSENGHEDAGRGELCIESRERKNTL